MKALILGGCGNMGSSIARDLRKSNDVGHIRLADITPDMARVHPSVRTSPKISAEYLDITKSFPELVSAIKASDVVINCIGPYTQFGTIVPRAAIAAGVNYVDLCDDCSVTKEIFELNEPAKEAGISICTGLGSTPGTTNMLGKYGADKLDTVDEIEVFFVIALIDPIGKAGLTGAMGQFIGNVTQYIDGRYIEVPAGSGGEEVTFMEPFGKTEVYYARHPEPFTLPRYIPGVRRVINKASFSPSSVVKLFTEFINLGLFSAEPLTAGNTSITPRDFTLSFVQHMPQLRGQTTKPTASLGNVVVVRGREGNQRVTYTYRVTGWGGPMTAIPASICAQMLYRGEVKTKGVVAPESALDPTKYLAELGKKGIHFFETKSSEQPIKFR